MSEKKKRLVISHKHQFNHSCEDIFKLACPIKECDWLPGWKEQLNMVYSESGFGELSCVFLTKNWPHLMGTATWVNNVYEPFKKIQYCAINDKIVYQNQMELKPLSSGCEAVMTRTWTALTWEAEEFLGKLRTSIDQKATDLFELINYYLTTGKIMGSKIV